MVKITSWSCFPGLKNDIMTQCFLCLGQKNMVSITRWFYKWGGHTPAFHCSWKSCHFNTWNQFHTNSITQENSPKDIKKTSLHVWDREEFELQTELSLTIFNVILYFISVLWRLLRKELSNCSSWQNNLIFMKDLPKHWVSKTRMKSVYNQSFQENRFISQKQDKIFSLNFS